VTAKRRLVLPNSERGYLTLIGLLIAIVIIGILFALYAGGPTVGPSPEREGAATTTLGGAKRSAQGALCRNNLSQLRAAVSLYVSNSGSYPPSLEALDAGVSLRCPVGGEPYQYDFTAGKVHCVHPGHEGY